jgi:triosephosphate isomerase
MDRSRVPIVAGNWKMHTTLEEAGELVRALRQALEGPLGVTVVLCPPFVSLDAVRGELEGSSLRLGAQNMHWEASGAFTGEVGPAMLAGLCDYVILGHSERRASFGETDEVVNRKVQAALRHGLTSILCIGETWEEREAGRTRAVLERQLRGALVQVPSPQGIVIAYEPVWAIGTGRAATPHDANEAIDFIRKTLASQYDASTAQSARILYGGSVTPQNAASLLAEQEIDGALVGGASLRAADFAAIVRQATFLAARL